MRASFRLFTQLPDAEPGQPLPTEFRIFRKGENPSTKGAVMFDDRAAELCMAAAAKWGNDYAIDLEHYSLRPRMVDPMSTDADARGYFRPEMRDGELWATGVTWTEDGQQRLRGRRQRYMSPAFYTQETDETSGMPRVTELLNVGLVAQPASDQIDALVASAVPLDSSSDRGYAPPGMTTPASATPEQTPPAVAAPAVVVPVVVEAPAPVVESEDETPPAAEDPESKAVEVAVCSIAGETSIAKALVVLSRRLVAQSGAANLQGAIQTFSTALTDIRAVHAAELRSLVTDLVALGAETPATAWSNNAPVARLASEGLPGLRSRVAALRTVKGATAAVTPPAASANPEDGLTDFERRDADKIKNPEARSRFVASRLARKNKAQ
jgi:hypothetical protein